MTSNIAKFLLLSLSLLTFHPPSTSQSFSPYLGRRGQWQLLQSNIGISAMHMQLMHDNKVMIFDRTDFGMSNISLPDGRCRFDANDQALIIDCTAHSILYDIPTNTFRPLMLQTDAWCSSGAILPNGTLIQTGGFNDGDHVIRSFSSCLNEQCDWIEFPNYLSQRRWYASNHILPDGRIIIVGGRKQFNYEFFPSNSRTFRLKLLRQSYDYRDENNLYPFLHLLPDGNLFIFANTRSILLDYKRNRVVREFPMIPHKVPRNYPSSGSSVLLPINENTDGIEAEVLICGGAPRGSYHRAETGTYIAAASTCGRLMVSDQNPKWTMETMPTSRVMSDMILLPTGDVIIINGAQSGTAGYDDGRNPATIPLIYRPEGLSTWRFSTMAASSIPRMYHSTAILLPDGRVLVGGSNPHAKYNFTALFPTDLSLEAFSPPYLSPEYSPIRPTILSLNNRLGYGNSRFVVRFHVEEFLSEEVLSVRIVSPSFTTHSFSMNQRMVILRLLLASSESSNTHTVDALGPSKAEIAPPGYYLLFVVHAGIPSNGAWVKIG
ncbi:aldehyde oxidase GLOX1 [Euphorbia lathyris]|uniref:aldehyde oxidase GLOX1 n=1 Tax=Euphorbia lathyris TaxID=212925 RepID=UPI0033131440